ncbi:glycosyl hydrolase [Haloferula helveola]|uniref:Glycosyl hydrolase n=1 Tax=Haloferula helveola TaxID=490095 RepID=A0ABN6H8N5_9BACT|nr:glycosyl hydrolase [Haloferula helveola]
MKAPLLLIAGSLPLLAAEPNTLTPEEKKDGFELIFDGKSLDGWRTYKQEKPKDKWVVEDGAITLTAKGGGDLITDAKYKDFELRFQFKIAPEGNSGIMWHVAEIDGPPYLTGPEYQILDSNAKTGYQHEIKKGNIAGAFYDLVPGKAEWSKPAGEWNDGSIRIEGSKITLTVNGTTTAEVDTSTDEWKEMLAKSKFANWDKFNKMPEGHICLQDHGDKVAFRTVRIKEL